ncbi:MAG: sigma-70 family RNA polymerase sigma factor [Paludibacteraceae bacterium]|nr:sigma-70 family RNA polymerase sigma factor [Paludibacteraceae bacterium]
MNNSRFDKQILDLSDMLFRLARSILKNEAEAQDAVQDLHLKMWEKRRELSVVENLKAFSMRSMRNLCIDKLRHYKDDVDVESDIMYDAPDPYKHTEQSDTVARIKKMIDALPELQSTIIRLRDVEGFELAEIAEITGLNINAATVNLSRARQKIRDQILLENNITEKHYGRY